MTCHRIVSIDIHIYFCGLAETHAIGDETKWLADLSVRLNFVASTAFSVRFERDLKRNLNVVKVYVYE